jgi:hypothetical protein
MKEGVCLLVDIQPMHLAQQILHLMILLLLFEADSPGLDSGHGGVTLRTAVTGVVAGAVAM